MTDGARWEDADRLLEQALELAPDAREAFLEERAGAEPGLVREVRALLALQEAAAGRIGESVADYAAPLLADLGDAGPEPAGPAAEGMRIGPYRVIRELARGGMGAVYLAERADDEYRQQVAIKLVKRGMDTAEVLDRFRHERQILASLVHPAIAQLHDGGATADGLPYLVMEYVDGQPIDRWCEERRLGVDERLALFETVCAAVQYAHQNLVVHRDLKPSNVMVTADGAVKLLDFGIAKVLASGADAEAPRTRTEMRLLTPEYAAPEQRTGAAVTTATDVYALGILLCKLLTGRRPNEADATGDAGAELVRPSALAPSPALARRLRGDLDAIVLKASEADPARRYASVQQLIEDVERHRRGLPVLARRGTARYRIRKYVRRHRAGVAAAALLLVLLTAFAVFYNLRITRERDLARAEAEKAQATTRFLKGLFEAASPYVALGDTLTVYELLDRGAGAIDSLESQALVQATLLTTLGEVYRELGAYDRAKPLLDRAVAVHRRQGEESVDLARTLSAAGFLAWDLDDVEQSLAQQREALAIFRRLVPPDDPELLSTMNNVAVAASGNAEYAEAAALHEEILAARRRIFGDTSPEVAVTRNNLGMTFARMGDTVSAERELRAALGIRRVVLDSAHPDVALSLNNLATVLARSGRLEEAEPLHREALAMRRALLGPAHPGVAVSAYNLAALLEKRGRYSEAEPLLVEAAAIDRDRLGANHEEVAVDLLKLGTVQRLGGRCESAIPTLREAARIFALHQAADDTERQEVDRQLAQCVTATAAAGP